MLCCEVVLVVWLNADYQLFYVGRSNRKRWHVFLHILTGILVLVGLAAVLAHKLLGKESIIPSSGHSYLGTMCILLHISQVRAWDQRLLVQWVYGCFFVWPLWDPLERMWPLQAEKELIVRICHLIEIETTNLIWFLNISGCWLVWCMLKRSLVCRLHRVSIYSNDVVKHPQPCAQILVLYFVLCSDFGKYAQVLLYLQKLWPRMSAKFVETPCIRGE